MADPLEDSELPKETTPLVLKLQSDLTKPPVEQPEVKIPELPTDKVPAIYPDSLTELKPPTASPPETLRPLPARRLARREIELPNATQSVTDVDAVTRKPD